MPTSDQDTGDLAGGDNASRTRVAYLDGQYASMFPTMPDGVTEETDLLDMIFLALGGELS